MNGDTGGVNLNVRGICKVSTLAIALDGSGAVATHSVGAQEIGVTVTASSDDHGVGAEANQLTSCQILGDDTTGATIDDDHILHLIAGVEFYFPSIYLAAQRAVSTEQQLLTCLAFSIECTRNLGTTEGTVGQHAAILTGEGNTLGHALVDDIVRDLSQTT